jgi:hypothetical protein
VLAEPVTDAGKLGACLNALKHGVTALRGGLSLPELREHEGDLKGLAAQIVLALNPRDVGEERWWTR